MNNQLKKGTKIESEHRTTYHKMKAYTKKYNKFPPEKMMYTEIAKEHLKEHKNYYNKIKKCGL